ncbi:MAG: hypothetical protein QOJ15_3178 [Bradyrhizobium sp.]|jgi:hypothetical protein|nr:hypothetical protein [Bradyrhizobium sp.]
MPGSFRRNILEARFTLAQGGFAGGVTSLNTLDLKNLRMQAKAVNAGGAAMGELQLTIFGMTPSQMNTLSTLGMRIQQVPIRNAVTLMAGKEGDAQLSMMFEGGIQSAYADMEAQPEVAFRVVAKSGLPQAVTAIPSTSYQSAADVATVLQNLAQQGGLAFENNGVSVIMAAGQHYTGSLRNQIQTCAENADIGWSLDKKTLIIWPKNGSRTGDAVLVSESTGMIGYPAYSAMGIRVRSLFNPAIRFQGKIEIALSSDDPIKLPRSTWTVYKLEHDLSSQYPRGPWESAMECYNPDFPQPVPG